MTAKDSLITFKYMDCSKTYEKKLDEDILKGFQNAQKIGDEDLEKFSFMLCKGAYP